MDAKNSIVTEQGYYVAQIKTADLAIFSYYVESNKEAILIDPTLDTTIYKEIIAKRGSTLKHVLLTHYHADYLSGHTQFNVPIVMGPTSKREVNTFKVEQFKEGEEITLGHVKIRVLHTPGHTPESTCYLLVDGCKDQCVFTGDTVFLGDVGRPDLAIKSGESNEDQAAVLFDSIQKIKALDGTVRIYPGHGSGSSCGKAIGTGNFCNVEKQKLNNYGFKFTDKAEFVKAVVAELPKPPKYFFHDAQLNQTGVGAFESFLEKANRPLSAEQFGGLLGKVPIIETRNNPESIIQGEKVYWFLARGSMTSWLANILSPEEQFVIMTSPGLWREIAERFFRIGYFNIRGYNDFTMSDWKGPSWKPKIVNFDQFKELKDVKHLDVRNKPEYASGGVIENSILIPLPELYKRVGELKDAKNILVNCRTGVRARVASGVLASAGIQSSVFSEPLAQFQKKAGIKIVPYQP